MAALSPQLSSIATAANTPAVQPTPAPKPAGLIVGMLVFEDFELLDVFGPLEMFGMLRDKVSLTLIAEKVGPVRSSAGPVVVADRALSDDSRLDILLIPGGWGTRREVNNASLVARLKELSEKSPHVASICTGSAILARTGLLDGRKATTNKRAYAWATSQGPNVAWVSEARWVEDGKFFTSSGVSAGMDMALGLIAKIFDSNTAIRVAQGAEYTWHEDKSRDPFAKLHGL